MAKVATRSTAEERRHDVLEAALIEFAERGLSGTSTEDIARRAGISQPYLFRLFGTKKELFKAAVARCFIRTLAEFQSAAEGLRGQEALQAIGERYKDAMITDRMYLRAQMQAYAACDDPEIAAVVRQGYGDLVTYIERVSGLPPAGVAQFFANGMLLNVLASMDVAAHPEPWAQRLIEGCGKEL
jgi:AcrR family transcriptional regulator